MIFFFRTKYTVCAPEDKAFRSLYLVRWLAKLPYDFESRKIENSSETGKEIVRQLLNLITIRWVTINLKDGSETLETLMSVLGFLGGAYVTILDQTKQLHYVSPILCRLIERIPSQFITPMIDKFAAVTSQITNEQLLKILSKMFQWPMNNDIYPWILAILESLTKSMRSELVYQSAVYFARHIAVQLKEPLLCQGALQLCLFGFFFVLFVFVSILLKNIEENA